MPPILPYHTPTTTPARTRGGLGIAACVGAIILGGMLLTRDPPTSFYTGLELAIGYYFYFGGFGIGIALAAAGLLMNRKSRWAMAGLALNLIGLIKAGIHFYGMYWYARNQKWM
jgi:peptidoglycan/LPS O-acetylase OafA/YrhL